MRLTFPWSSTHACCLCPVASGSCRRLAGALSLKSPPMGKQWNDPRARESGPAVLPFHQAQ
jgi:hypothetical protein